MNLQQNYNNQKADLSITSSSYTANPGDRLVNTVNTTYVDFPNPVNGQSYQVKISGGIATISSVGFGKIGAVITRSYNNGIWKTFTNPSIPLQTRIQVCNRCVSSTSALSNSSTETQAQYRVFHRMCAAGATDISLLYVHSSNSSTNIVDNVTSLGTLTIKAAIEYNSVIYPVTFNGRRTVTVEAGGRIESDPLGIKIPSSATFFTRQYITCSGGSFVRGNITASSRGEGGEIGVAVTDKVDSGTITQGNAIGVFSPAAILGRPLTANYGSVAIFMDSLSSGVGSATLTEDRGFVDKAFSGIYGVCNLGVSGGTLASWSSQGDALSRRATLAKIQPTVIFAGSGGNDLNSSGVTAATVEALLTTFWNELKFLNCSIIGWTIPPRTTSTDSWATLGNQTINSPNANWETERLALNTWIRAGGGGLLTTFIDFAAIVEDGGLSQTGKWKVTGSANGYTSDGNHPNDTAQALIAAAINTSYATAINS